MSELEIIRDLAKQALVIPSPISRQSFDNYLWDRAQRLVRYADFICQLPELGKTAAQIDMFCLKTAAYFSDSGLVRFVQGGDIASKWKMSESNIDNILDFCTQVVEEKLTSVINEQKLKKVNKIILESANRFTRMTEAMILSDARNLDDMGAVGLFNEFKRYAFSGKGISDVIHAWRRKIDYQYWQARLKEGFRFESVRKLAEQRLAAAEGFMQQLKTENAAADFEEMPVQSALV